MDFNRNLFFNSLVAFVSDLSCVFGKKQHSLLLYNRLLEKVKPVHKDEVSKQLSIFSDFLRKNRQAILEKDYTKFEVMNIVYSEKVNIKMEEIFKMSDDAETTSQIWKHLIYMTSILDPNDEKATFTLQECFNEKSKEGDFLQNICKKIESNVKPDADPMTAITGLLQNGVITDLLGDMQKGMKDGSLNMNKLFSSFQGMLGQMNENGEGGGMEGMPDLSKLMSMLPMPNPTDERKE